MEEFYKTHTNLVENTQPLVRRMLMDEIDWSDRLIGIKGTRGVGKTTFLLQYAREKFSAGDRRCLYVNMNNFYFQGHGIADFAGSFYAKGGRYLLIDQVFKQPDWSRELRRCYDIYPELKIVFTGSSVMRLKEENPDIGGIVKSYNLRGFSFREFLNLTAGTSFRPYTLEEILSDHERIVKSVLPQVAPGRLFLDYIHHGFYPFFREHRNYSENLLKTMNMMTEVDILLIKQIELKCLTKIKKLLYLLAVNGQRVPNISLLAADTGISRATVMNYIKCLADARLVNMIYPVDQSFPKKPTKVMMHNSNLMYAFYPIQVRQQSAMETFFINTMWKDYLVSQEAHEADYTVQDRRLLPPDGTPPEELARLPKHRGWQFRVCDVHVADRQRLDPGKIYACYNTEISHGQQCPPLWLLGFLY